VLEFIEINGESDVVWVLGDFASVSDDFSFTFQASFTQPVGTQTELLSKEKGSLTSAASS